MRPPGARARVSIDDAHKTGSPTCGFVPSGGCKSGCVRSIVQDPKHHASARSSPDSLSVFRSLLALLSLLSVSWCLLSRFRLVSPSISTVFHSVAAILPPCTQDSRSSPYSRPEHTCANGDTSSVDVRQMDGGTVDGFDGWDHESLQVIVLDLNLANSW